MVEKDGSTGSLPVKGSLHGSSGSLSHLTQKPYVTNRNTKQQFKALMKKNYILKVPQLIPFDHKHAYHEGYAPFCFVHDTVEYLGMCTGAWPDNKTRK